MHIVPSNICSAFEASGVIGSKVINHDGFMAVLRAAIEAHDFTQDRIQGQAFLPLPRLVLPHVSCGTGRHSSDHESYVLREHRGRVSAFLRRELAAPVESCAAVVYTMEAYLRDPDITTEEASRIVSEAMLGDDDKVSSKDCYVIVAVLATAGPQSQLSPFRFVHNLAGGNKEAQVWTADEIRAKAREILSYDNDWATVADPV